MPLNEIKSESDIAQAVERLIAIRYQIIDLKREFCFLEDKIIEHYGKTIDPSDITEKAKALYIKIYEDK